RPHILNVIFDKPAPNLAERMSMLLGMMILIPQPCLAACWLRRTIGEYRILGHPAPSCQTAYEAAQQQWNARKAVVKAKDDHSTWSRKFNHAAEVSAGIGRVMEDARAIDDIESARTETCSCNVRFDEEQPVVPKAPSRFRSKHERGPRQISTDHDAVCACKIETHLARSAADFGDPGVTGNSLIEQSRKRTALGTRAQPRQAIIGGISRKRCRGIKVTHDFRPVGALEAQRWNTVGRCVATAA